MMMNLHENTLNEPGDSLSDMTLPVLERVKSSGDMYRKKREQYTKSQHLLEMTKRRKDGRMKGRL